MKGRKKISFHRKSWCLFGYQDHSTITSGPRCSCTEYIRTLISRTKLTCFTKKTQQSNVDNNVYTKLAHIYATDWWLSPFQDLGTWISVNSTCILLIFCKTKTPLVHQNNLSHYSFHWVFLQHLFITAAWKSEIWYLLYIICRLMMRDIQAIWLQKEHKMKMSNTSKITYLP